MFGCRNGELRKAKKTDFDLKRKVWVVPVVNNKTGKKLAVKSFALFYLKWRH